MRMRTAGKGDSWAEGVWGWGLERGMYRLKKRNRKFGSIDNVRGWLRFVHARVHMYMCIDGILHARTVADDTTRPRQLDWPML